jgi:hypothetical protein
VLEAVVERAEDEKASQLAEHARLVAEGVVRGLVEVQLAINGQAPQKG